jgi:hypothetical protein
VFIWSSVTKWRRERSLRRWREPIAYRAERVPASSLSHAVQSKGSERAVEVLRLTPRTEAVRSVAKEELFDPSPRQDKDYLAQPAWAPLERLTLEMPSGTHHAERSRCVTALSVRSQTRIYGQDLDIDVSDRICNGLRKLRKYEKRRSRIDKFIAGIGSVLLFLVPAAIFWLIHTAFPKYNFNANHGFTALLGVGSILIFISSGALRWRNIMTSFSVSRITASVFVGLLIAPGTFIFVSYRGQVLDKWQMAALVVSLSVAGGILIGIAMSGLQNSAELRLLPRYIDEDVIGVMMLNITLGLRYMRDNQLVPFYANRRFAYMGLKTSLQQAAAEMQRLARVIEILFISISRQTLATQSLALLNSRKRQITSTIRARASLILLPGIDYDAIIHDIVEDASLALDGNWKALASQQAMIDASTESISSQVMSRVGLAAAILAGAFILPYLPDLIPVDQRADVQKTLVVSAFLALINASRQD